MGQALGGIKDVFSNAGDVVQGTGQTVGDLQKAGWTAADMAGMGLKAAPSTGIEVARDITKLGLGGLSGLQNQQGQAQRSAPAQIDVPDAQLTPGLYNSNYITEYLNSLRKPVGTNSFYGQ